MHTLKSSSKPSIWEAISVEVGRLLAVASWASLAGVGTRACTTSTPTHEIQKKLMFLQVYQKPGDA